MTCQTKFQRDGHSIAHAVALATNDYLVQEAFANQFAFDRDVYAFHAPKTACGSDWAREAIAPEYRHNHMTAVRADEGV